MARTLTASDRRSLIRLASTLPKGSPERRTILAGLSKQASVEGETFDLMGQLSPDFGAQSAGAWVDDVTYGKRRWRNGQLVTPYRAQLSGTIEGVAVADPDTYRNALLKMAPWKEEYDNYGSKIEQIYLSRKLKNGINMNAVIFLYNVLSVSTSFHAEGLEGSLGEDLEAAGRMPEYGTPEYQKLLLRVEDLDEKFLEVFRSPPSGFTFNDDFWLWELKPTSPARDLKKAKAAMKQMLDSISKVYEVL